MRVKEEMVTFLLCLSRVIPSAHFPTLPEEQAGSSGKIELPMGTCPHLFFFANMLWSFYLSQWVLGVPSAGGQARSQPDERPFRVKCVAIKETVTKRSFAITRIVLCFHNGSHFS